MSNIRYVCTLCTIRSRIGTHMKRLQPFASARTDRMMCCTADPRKNLPTKPQKVSYPGHDLIFQCPSASVVFHLQTFWHQFLSRFLNEDPADRRYRKKLGRKSFCILKLCLVTCMDAIQRKSFLLHDQWLHCYALIINKSFKNLVRELRKKIIRKYFRD